MMPTRSFFTLATNITGPAEAGHYLLMSTFRFEVTHTPGRARRGVLTTPHGAVNTPAFMAVGTQGAVKAVTHRDLEDLGSEIILANTYHLYLRPGAARIGAFGG